ncbi:MAG: VWA domain-containing protein, partial [Myxococcota bacterium]
ILDQERSSLFTQQVGNIPPGQEVVCEIEIDQPLVWLPEGSWEWRFPTVVGARYMGASGRVADAERIAVAVADTALAPRMTLSLLIADELADGAAPDSPSHALRSVQRYGAHEVSFRSDRSVRLDRDIAVRWAVAAPEVGVALEVTRPSGAGHSGSAYGLVTVVPPRADADMQPLPRDLIVLIDTSGSMGGRPLDQAKRVVCAMIDSLGNDDRLELIEFGSRPVRWREEPVAATRDGRRQAIKWVRALRPSGATEMHAAVLEALRPLRPKSQRQVVLITDGYIGFEQEIIETVLGTLPTGCRLHTIGVGSAPNRSLTRPAARVGNGVELIIGIDEDAEQVAGRLLARTTAPLISDLQLSGDALQSTATARLPDLFAGSPALLAVELDPRGGQLTVRGTAAGSPFSRTVSVPAKTLGQGDMAVAALYARERVADLEARRVVRGNTDDIDQEIERIGLDFQIATRLTSWVAITEDATTVPGDESINRTVAQEQPHGTQIAAFGLRPGAAPMMARASAPGAMRSMAGLAAPTGAPLFDDDEVAFDDKLESLADLSLDEAAAPGSFPAGPMGMVAPPPPAAAPARAKAEARFEPSADAARDEGDGFAPESEPMRAALAAPRSPEPLIAEESVSAPRSPEPLITEESVSASRRRSPALATAILIAILAALAILLWALLG